jgi:hypothetical protein
LFGIQRQADRRKREKGQLKRGDDAEPTVHPDLLTVKPAYNKPLGHHSHASSYQRRPYQSLEPPAGNGNFQTQGNSASNNQAAQLLRASLLAKSGKVGNEVTGISSVPSLPLDPNPAMKLQRVSEADTSIAAAVVARGETISMETEIEGSSAQVSCCCIII